LDERLDVFPNSEPNAPILIFIHGGYWHDPVFTKDKYSWVAKGPVSSGVTTVFPDYALCPKVTVDEIVRQCRAAVAWVYQNAASFGGDHSQMYVTGNSAGGHLTAMVLATDWEGEYGLPVDVIKGGFPISGLFDLRPFPYTFLQPKLQLNWGEVLRNSPLLNIPESAPPILVTYGGDEPSELCRQSDDFLATWRAQGLKGDYLPQPSRNHYTAIEGFLEADSPLCDAILKQMGLKPSR